MNSKPVPQLVIFDCDGVLIDSEILSLQAWQDVLAPHGLTISQTYFVERFLGKSMASVVNSLKQDFDFELDDTLSDTFHQRLQTIFEHELRPTPGITEVLEKLTVPYCLATSSSPQRTRHALDTTGLASFFTNNRFTRYDVTRGKPAPDLFLHAARTMGVTPEHCLVIEDSPAGLQAADAAAMHKLRYLGASHLPDSLAAPSDLLHWQQLQTRFADIF